MFPDSNIPKPTRSWIDRKYPVGLGIDKCTHYTSKITLNGESLPYIASDKGAVLEVRDMQGVVSNLRIPRDRLFGYYNDSSYGRPYVVMDIRHFALYRELEFLGFSNRLCGDIQGKGRGLYCVCDGLFVKGPSRGPLLQSLGDQMVAMSSKARIAEVNGEQCYLLPLYDRYAVYRIKDYDKFKRALAKAVTLIKKGVATV